MDEVAYKRILHPSRIERGENSVGDGWKKIKNANLMGLGLEHALKSFG